jgi:hypothetical protein
VVFSGWADREFVVREADPAAAVVLEPVQAGEIPPAGCLMDGVSQLLETVIRADEQHPACGRIESHASASDQVHRICSHVFATNAGYAASMIACSRGATARSARCWLASSGGSWAETPSAKRG